MFGFTILYKNFAHTDVDVDIEMCSVIFAYYIKLHCLVRTENYVDEHSVLKGIYDVFWAHRRNLDSYGHYVISLAIISARKIRDSSRFF